MFQQIKDLFVNTKSQMSLTVAILGALMIISGSVSFAMFLAEEAMQVTTFAAFSYTSSKDWDGLESHLMVMKAVDRSASFFIRYVGWLSPLMYPAYLDYLKGNKQYIRTMERRIKLEREAERKGRWKK